MSEDAITRPALRIGIVGWGWMGQVHARAYARLRQHYPDAPMQPSLVAVADMRRTTD
jgi:predicted dehydrogenase